MLGDRVKPIQAIRVHVAGLAARGAHQVYLYTALGVKRQRAASGRRFRERDRAVAVEDTERGNAGAAFLARVQISDDLLRDIGLLRQVPLVVKRGKRVK